ncbi:MAG: EamA family transporter [Elusimicrobia bacterium]|nr:EamA family transporter [Elusimicrobiota bacterium]
MNTDRELLLPGSPFVLACVSIFLWACLAYLSTTLARVPPFLLVGTAMAFGALPSVPWWRDWFRDPKILLPGTAGLFGYHFFLFMALRLAPPIEANLINYLWPVLIVLLSAVLLKDQALNLRQVLGGALALSGAALIVTGGRFNFSLTYIKGYSLAFAAALTWAAYSVLTKRARGFPTSAVGGFCFVSALLCLGTHALIEESVPLRAGELGRLFMLGFGPMGLAFYAWDSALKKGNPQLIGTLAYLTPLLSTLILAVMSGRRLSAVHFAAMALIVGGAAVGGIRGKNG